MIRTVFVALLAGLFAVGIIATNGGGTNVAQRHSCGYHCNPDGSAATEAAPPAEPEIMLARVNQHSGGREGGAANKRVGHPGGPNHPNSVTVGNAAGLQLLAVDGFGRNRGTRPHHPRTSCRCN